MTEGTEENITQAITQPAQTSKSRRKCVWQDDDEVDMDDDSEPEWVQKRRKYLEEAQQQRISADVDTDLSTYTGKLTKVKPAKHASTVRFKIDRQKDSRHDITVNGGVKEVEFDKSNSLLGVLGSKERIVKLYKVDQHRSRGNNFRIKGETSTLAIGMRHISSFGFTNDGKNMLMITDHKSIVKYDVNQESMINIASITNPHTEAGYKRVYIPPNHDDRAGSDIFAISCANNGGVLVCDARSNSIVHHLQMNAQTIGVAFYLSKNSVITADGDANIYEWDVTTGKCLNKFKDDHSLHLTSFAISPNVKNEFSQNAFLSTGSRTGFLNRFPLAAEPHVTDTGNTYIQRELVKSYGNLSTAITSIATDESGTFIAYASEHKRNAIRIIHNPSGHVVANWPTDSINLGRITDLAFGSKYNILATGNRKGKVHLYRILTT